jgi:hypothetical protein
MKWNRALRHIQIRIYFIVKRYFKFDGKVRFIRLTMEILVKEKQHI